MRVITANPSNEDSYHVAISRREMVFIGLVTGMGADGSWLWPLFDKATDLEPAGLDDDLEEVWASLGGYRTMAFPRLEEAIDAAIEAHDAARQ